MVLKYESEPVLIKKKCIHCGRRIIVQSIDWKVRKDFECQTCKSLGREESKHQLRMANSKGISDRTTITKLDVEQKRDEK